MKSPSLRTNETKSVSGVRSSTECGTICDEREEGNGGRMGGWRKESGVKGEGERKSWEGKRVRGGGESR